MDEIEGRRKAKEIQIKEGIKENSRIYKEIIWKETVVEGLENCYLNRNSKGQIFFDKSFKESLFLREHINKKSKKILFSKTNHFLNMLDNFSDIIRNKKKINNHLQKCLIQSKLINKLRIKK